MKGWLVVGPPGIGDDQSLAEWVRRGAKYASALPKKWRARGRSQLLDRPGCYLAARGGNSE